jgi:hypothetical protein
LPLLWAGFYKGPVAEAIVAAVNSRGGCITLEDLAAHETEVTEPVSTTYRWDAGVQRWQPWLLRHGKTCMVKQTRRHVEGVTSDSGVREGATHVWLVHCAPDDREAAAVHLLGDVPHASVVWCCAVPALCRDVRVWETPPPTQGVAALVGLNLLEADEQLAAGQLPVGGPDWLHSAVESVRLAFADVLAANAGEGARCQPGCWAWACTAVTRALRTVAGCPPTPRPLRRPAPQIPGRCQCRWSSC